MAIGPSRRPVSAILVALLISLVLLAAFRMNFGESFGWPAAQDIFAIRLHRLLIAVIVGVGLASSGVSLQALLRNPLAEPFILGLSTGAGVGVMVHALLVGDGMAGNQLGALIGASISMTIVYIAGRRDGIIDPLGLLLVGVVLSTINGALIVMLNYTVGSAGLRDDLARWMMGYINEGITMAQFNPVVIFTFASLAVLIWQGRAMDVATFSDSEAEAIGVNLPRLRKMLFGISSLLAAAAVALVGPVAFIGLICPHLARLLVGPSHRNLVIAAAIIGAMLMLSADMLSISLHWAFDWGRLPLGVFTAMLGGVVFLFMVRPQMGRGM